MERARVDDDDDDAGANAADADDDRDGDASRGCDAVVAFISFSIRYTLCSNTLRTSINFSIALS